jgi:hypothetical protein
MLVQQFEHDRSTKNTERFRAVRPDGSDDPDAAVSLIYISKSAHADPDGLDGARTIHVVIDRVAPSEEPQPKSRRAPTGPKK